MGHRSAQMEQVTRPTNHPCSSVPSVAGNFFSSCLGVLGVLAVAFIGVEAHAQAPAVMRVEPSAVAPGRVANVTIVGSGLSEPAALWSTFPAEASFPADKEKSANRATCRLSVPPDAQVGIHALRLGTPKGVSNLHLVMVDDLPSVAATQGNGTAAAAQALPPPVAVDGACDAGGSDFYRFHADKGRRVSVEVVAARLGSQLDPVVRLLDAAGRELVWCDDSPGAGSDCRFAHTCAETGDYVIELRDAGYGGGADFRYRLRVGEFPLANVPFPLAGKRGTVGMFSFVGPDCAGAAPVTLNLPQLGGAAPLGVRYAGARAGSGFVSVAVGDVDESVEAEPNDTPLAATPITAPSAVSGRLETPNDRDFYQ